MLSHNEEVARNPALGFLRSRGKARYIADRLCSIGDFLGHPLGNVSCPFHIDNNPSAKVYEDEKGGPSRLYCYAERKTYFGSDYIERVLRTDVVEFLLQRYSHDTLILFNNGTDWGRAFSDLQKDPRDFREAARIYRETEDLDLLLEHVYGAREIQ